MRTVGEAMTRQVLTVHPDAPFKQIVEMLVGQGIDALPVVDESGKVLGVVSGSDLTCHEESGMSFGRLITDARTTITHARKARARTARELMSAPARTTSPSTGVCEALTAMNKGHVGRLVVMEGGRLAGILTRSDLLRVFTRSDEALQDDVKLAVQEATGSAGRDVTVHVGDGIAYLRGAVERASTVVAAAQAARGVPGIVDVEDDVTAEIDDVTVVTGFAGV